MVACREGQRQVLLKRADDAEKLAAELPERASRLLAIAAGYLREAAAVYDIDPTLVGDPTGRERDLDLIADLGRQFVALVRQACRPEHPRWPVVDRWAEADALAGCLPVLVEQARAVARPDHDTTEGSAEISQRRLAAVHGQVWAAGEQLEAAVRRAASLPYP
ncbi:hypothetical protein AB0B45_46885 [Nonomuraea sp. NPDC049152]|uniref:hypothetical protein n=1 Tax=Nonomuraea sp. NPDC049152 TaxID=3154350 RepID=UPI0033C855C2